MLMFSVKIAVGTTLHLGLDFWVSSNRKVGGSEAAVFDEVYSS